ncbi:hypothetical protein [Curtobacterium sp. ISL-83]|uniref:hypothetical protein n=1 Tax=Curtobacterium sp. ISL-83 TaxID=2819145 RepID=UPI001BE70DFB|nr:hypothetical protein [Curtobacterium sp. ISL-83]MBT2503865.1 hypothetical protein [Curtobacterium sp. ISL-83]
MTEGAGVEPTGGWTTRSRAALFWTTAVVGLPVAFGSWMVLWAASDEDNRGTAHDRSWPNDTILTLGVAPLVVAHLLGLVLLITTGRGARRDRASAMVFGVVAFVIDSAVGVTTALVLTGGSLVEVTPSP